MDTRQEARQQRVVWWKATSPDLRSAVAARCGTSVATIRQVVYGQRGVSIARAKALEAETGLDRRWWLPEAWG